MSRIRSHWAQNGIAFTHTLRVKKGPRRRARLWHLETKHSSPPDHIHSLICYHVSCQESGSSKRVETFIAVSQYLGQISRSLKNIYWMYVWTLERMWSISHTKLVKVSVDQTTLEDNLSVSNKVKLYIAIAHGPAIPFLGI